MVKQINKQMIEPDKIGVQCYTILGLFQVIQVLKSCLVSQVICHGGQKLPKDNILYQLVF